MNDAVLLQHCYPGDFIPMLELTLEHNQRYCDKWSFDYWHEITEWAPYQYASGDWHKVAMILKAMEKGYSKIVWLDADALIYDVKTSLREAIQENKIGACWHRIPQLNHWNVGALYISTTAQTEAFVKAWLASYPPPPDGWFEQGVFNRMGREGRAVVTISDKWNATLNVNMVPDAVVLGYHGAGDAQNRLRLMRDTMARLYPDKKAFEAQGLGEVVNG